MSNHIDLTPVPGGIGGYAAAITTAYFPFEITEGGGPDFRGGMATGKVGALRLSHLYASTPFCGRRRKETRGDDGPAFVVHVMHKGSVEFRQSKQRTVASPGDMVLIDPVRPLETEMLSSAEAFAVSIPVRLIKAHCSDTAAWRLSSQDASPGMASILHDMVTSCWHRRGLLESSDYPFLGDAIIKMVAATFLRHELPQFASRSARKLFLRITELVFANLDNPALSGDWIARQLGISKSYLYAIMGAAGMPLQQLILDQRLQWSRRLLADQSQSRSVSDIAFSVGFNDLSHFSRKFAHRFGMSPTAFRRSQTSEGG